MPLALTRPYDTGRSLDQLIPLLSPAVWFRFQDVGGTTVTDASGNGRNGLAVPGTGTVTLSAGQAAIGAAGRITIANNAAFSVPARGGLTVWCLELSSVGSFLVTKGGLSSNNYEWGINRPASQVTAVTHGTGGSAQSNVTSVGLTGAQSARINAIAAVFWDTSNLAPHAVGCNGQYQKPAPTQTASSAPTNTASVVTLGSRQDAVTADFVGTFYQFAIFPYAMDALGLLDLSMAAIRSGFDVPLAA